MFPADFCELGIERFKHDLDRFAFIRTDILKSLRDTALQKGDSPLIYPTPLRSRVEEEASLKKVLAIGKW